MGDQDPKHRPECESVLGDYYKWAVNKDHLNKYARIVLENLKKEQDDFLCNFLSKNTESFVQGKITLDLLDYSNVYYD